MNFNSRRAAPVRGLLVAALGALATAAQADGPPVSIQLNIGAPPPVYVPAPGYPPAIVAPAPSMVWMPQLGAYIALGIEQQIFYLGGVYYYFYQGGWYSGPRYGGPWRRMERPPRQLRHFDGRDWGRYQNEARGHANEQHWRQFHPAPAPRWNGPERGQPGRGGEQRRQPEERGRGQGRGHGDPRDQGGYPMRGGDR